MSVISWIRDLFGIQKDMYDTKRTRLEIRKLEDAERVKLITPATIADVKKYDPKLKVLIDKISGRGGDGMSGGGIDGGSSSFPLALYMLVAGYREHRGRFILKIIALFAVCLLTIYLALKAIGLLLSLLW